MISMCGINTNMNRLFAVRNRLRSLYRNPKLDTLQNTGKFLFNEFNDQILTKGLLRHFASRKDDVVGTSLRLFHHPGLLDPVQTRHVVSLQHLRGIKIFEISK